MQSIQYCQLPLNQIVEGDCKNVMKTFPDESIDLVMFSPPYFGLRDYGVEAESVWGEHVACDHEWTNAKPVRTRGYDGKHAKGIIWPTLHGKICSKCGAWKGQLGLEYDWRMYINHLLEVCEEIKRVLKKEGSMYIVIGDVYNGRSHFKDYPVKSLMGIPWRLAFALIEKLNFILRNDIIWVKPNALPSSVKDRLSNKYEHIFHFVKSRKYYYNLDAIREPHSSVRDLGRKRTEQTHSKYYGVRPSGYLVQHPLGKNPGDLWRIPTRPFNGPHLAPYPPEICVRPILSSCPPNGIVLDPFAGSGTTCMVAKALGRKWIGIEICSKYAEMARARVNAAPNTIVAIENVSEAWKAVDSIR